MNHLFIFLFFLESMFKQVGQEMKKLHCVLHKRQKVKGATRG